MTITVESQFKQLQSSPKISFLGASIGLDPVASAFMLQCSTSWAIYTGAGQVIEFIKCFKTNWKHGKKKTVKKKDIHQIRNITTMKKLNTMLCLKNCCMQFSDRWTDGNIDKKGIKKKVARCFELSRKK